MSAFGAVGAESGESPQPSWNNIQVSTRQIAIARDRRAWTKGIAVGLLAYSGTEARACVSLLDYLQRGKREREAQ